MDRDVVIAILNELAAREQASLPPRLMESTVFVSRASVEAHGLIRRLAATARDNAAKLSEQIIRLGGTPGPRYVDARLAEVHYLDLSSLLPRLVRDREMLVQAYETAAPRLAADPQTTELVDTIRQRHREEFERLQVLVGDEVPLSK